MHDQPDWHPIMAAVEGPTGVWRMVAPDGVQYGTVELRRVMHGADVRYKAVWRGDVIGWATTLREACFRVHMAYVSAHGPSGAPMADWGGAGWRTQHRGASAPPRPRGRLP